MTVDEIINLITGPDRLRIFRDGREFFTGYVGMLINHEADYRKIKGLEVRSLRMKLDITHKEWEKRGLTAPLEPGILPKYLFKDLQMQLYYEIYT